MNNTPTPPAPKESVGSKIRSIAAIVLFITMVGIGSLYHNDTLVSWWLPIEVAVLLALTTLPFACRLKALSKWFDRIVYTLYATGVFYFLLLMINGAGLDTSTAVEKELMVVNKYAQQHRTRRHHSTSTHRYTTHHIVVRDDTGRTFKIQVQKSRYPRIPVNRPLKVQVMEGRLGFAVIDRI